VGAAGVKPVKDAPDHVHAIGDDGGLVKEDLRAKAFNDLDNGSELRTGRRLLVAV